MFNSAKDQKNLLSRDGEYGGIVGLTPISCLFSNYLFRMNYENSTDIVDYGTGNIVCHLLFSGSCAVVQDISIYCRTTHTLKPYNVKKYKYEHKRNLLGARRGICSLNNFKNEATKFSNDHHLKIQKVLKFFCKTVIFLL